MNFGNKIFRYFYMVVVAFATSFQAQAMKQTEPGSEASVAAQSNGVLAIAKTPTDPINGCDSDKESKVYATQQEPNTVASVQALSQRDSLARHSVKRIIEAYSLVDGAVIDFIDANARVVFDSTTGDNKKASFCCTESVTEKSDVSQGTKLCTPSVSGDKESKDSTKSSPDLEKLSIKELKELVATGNADAMNELGQRFEVGNGVAKNENMAITHYIVAACELKPASPRAMRNLARCVIDGKGNLRVSIAPALDLLQYASQLGDVDAKVMLAYCRCNFFGIYDLSEASVRRVMKEANDLAAEAARLKGESYVNALSAKLKQDHFGFHLQKCAYCSEDFINLNGTKRNDVVELQNESVAHRHCCEANHA